MHTAERGMNRIWDRANISGNDTTGKPFHRLCWGMQSNSHYSTRSLRFQKVFARLVEKVIANRPPQTSTSKAIGNDINYPRFRTKSKKYPAPRALRLHGRWLGFAEDHMCPPSPLQAPNLRFGGRREIRWPLEPLLWILIQGSAQHKWQKIQSWSSQILLLKWQYLNIPLHINIKFTFWLSVHSPLDEILIWRRRARRARSGDQNCSRGT